MRPMTRLVLGVVALAGIFAAVAVGLPSHVTVTRFVVINAPESAIFPYLNDLHQFGDWSPWTARDPQLALSYGGPQTGKGARVTWSSTVPSIGTGSMEITDSQPNRRIDLTASFNGLEGTSAYDVVPSGSGSKVTWSFGYESGSSPLKRWKALTLDGFVGTEYRTGLDRLKDKIEADRRPITSPAGGVSTEPPSAGLPPGTAPQPGAPAQQGVALPPGQQVAPASGTAAPAPAGAPGTQPNAAPTASGTAASPTTSAPKPPVKKKRRPPPPQ